VRIWDIAPELLCRNHLLGEHRELHAIWSILTKNKTGYSRHPEVLRWKGKLRALYLRHERLVNEMAERRYAHRSSLDSGLAEGLARQRSFVEPRSAQIRKLRAKKCGCRV
jgi:hypothetical protein